MAVATGVAHYSDLKLVALSSMLNDESLETPHVQSQSAGQWGVNFSVADGQTSYVNAVNFSENGTRSEVGASASISIVGAGSGSVIASRQNYGNTLRVRASNRSTFIANEAKRYYREILDFYGVMVSFSGGPYELFPCSPTSLAESTVIGPGIQFGKMVATRSSGSTVKVSWYVSIIKPDGTTELIESDPLNPSTATASTVLPVYFSDSLADSTYETTVQFTQTINSTAKAATTHSVVPNSTVVSSTISGAVYSVTKIY